MKIEKTEKIQIIFINIYIIYNKNENLFIYKFENANLRQSITFKAFYLLFI